MPRERIEKFVIAFILIIEEICLLSFLFVDQEGFVLVLVSLLYNSLGWNFYKYVRKNYTI
jgi:hypothetical protein